MRLGQTGNQSRRAGAAHPAKAQATATPHRRRRRHHFLRSSFDVIRRRTAVDEETALRRCQADENVGNCARVRAHFRARRAARAEQPAHQLLRRNGEGFAGRRCRRRLDEWVPCSTRRDDVREPRAPFPSRIEDHLSLHAPAALPRGNQAHVVQPPLSVEWQEEGHVDVHVDPVVRLRVEHHLALRFVVRRLPPHEAGKRREVVVSVRAVGGVVERIRLHRVRKHAHAARGKHRQEVEVDRPSAPRVGNVSARLPSGGVALDVCLGAVLELRDISHGRDECEHHRAIAMREFTETTLGGHKVKSCTFWR
eukprot:6201168-Pleurochrysis_carterae.AAC.5